MQSKSFETPDELRSVPHGNVKILDLGDIVVGRQVWEPGWRWSEHVKPIARMGDHRWRKVIADHDDRVRYQLASFRGREVKETGDGFLAIFDGTARAVRCAAVIRDAVAELGIQIRAGIHTGEVEVVPNDVRGVAVHTAARILALAGPGEILVSGTTHELLAGSGLTFEDRGNHELKGLSGVRSIYALGDGATSSQAVRANG